MGLTLGPKMIQSSVTQPHPRRLTNTGVRSLRPTKPSYLPVDNATRHLLALSAPAILVILATHAYLVGNGVLPATSMVYSTSKWPSATPQVVHCGDQTIFP